jgi:hypothetical protein
LLNFDEILYGYDAVAGDIDMMTLDPIASTVLQRLRFKFTR